MKFGAKKNPTVLAGGSRFAPNFIQNLYTVLKKRLWESRSSDGDFGKYFHLPVSVNFSKWILFTGKLPVNTKNLLTP
jgi:hypothetical protein